MRLIKYNVSFIILNAVLIALVNYSISGGFTFMLFLSLWIIAVAVFNLSVGYLLSSLLKSAKSLYFLAIIACISFVLSNIFIASFDPNGVGLAANLISTYKDAGTLYLIVLPYFLALLMVCAWCVIAERSGKTGNGV